MHNFETKVTIESKVLPGVKVTFRRLSRMARAKRDIAIASERVRLTEIYHERVKLSEPFQQEGSKVPFNVVMAIAKLIEEDRQLMDERVKPATIRPGFVSAEGIQYDGKPATAELILENGPDEFVDEVYELISEHSALTVEQQKNSSPPSGLLGPKVETESDTTAAPVSV